MKIAVTAASGQLGAAIVRATISIAGAENVVALARTPARAQKLGVEVRPGSYDKPGELEQSFEGIDTVLLVSGMEAPEKRVGQHRNVIAAAKAARVTKIVYTSVQGPEQGTAFSPVVQSNRQTEADVKASGLAWVIGRNGIYIEPDVDYIENYKAKGEIVNCAGDGKCGYTTRDELGAAYAQMLTSATHNRKTYALHGEAMTQATLAKYLSEVSGWPLPYRSMTVEAYRQERIAELGEFLGSIIAGIYEGIREGYYDHTSDFEAAAGRAHQTWGDYFRRLKAA
jgi:NAD(P)H dehydrogenase (quinone)